VTLLASCSVIAGCAARKPWVLAQGQHPQSFERRVSVDAQGRLLLFLPAGFDRSGATRYPLLIFLHGSGEAGEDLEKLKVLGPPRIVASREDFPFHCRLTPGAKQYRALQPGGAERDAG
jgi:predicted peptidase